MRHKTDRCPECVHSPVTGHLGMKARIAEMTEDIETLRAAIATPEVYAEVISKVLETERDTTVVSLKEKYLECASLKVRNTQLEKALVEISKGVDPSDGNPTPSARRAFKALADHKEKP